MCARTFHLNSREVYLDGIKRDRWCWSGDAYQSFMVNRYLYFEPSIIRRTIRALLGKRPYEQHINTINDYSAYLIISVWEYYYATGDVDFVNSIADDLYALYQFIVSRLNSETGYVEARAGDWIFIDWANIDKEGPISAEQILLWQVYRTMEKLSEVSYIPCGDYKERAERLKSSIMRDYWDDERSGFIDSFTSGKKHMTRHSGILAIMYDFVDKDKQNRIYENVLKGNIAEPITTPYFKFFELMALGKMGDIVGIQDYIDSYWGSMIELGATTVWEQFDPCKNGTEHLEMYGEKYGCSLCHAWGAGPIALLGSYCVGVKPTDIAYALHLVRTVDTNGFWSHLFVSLRSGIPYRVFMRNFTYEHSIFYLDTVLCRSQAGCLLFFIMPFSARSDTPRQCLCGFPRGNCAVLQDSAAPDRWVTLSQ